MEASLWAESESSLLKVDTEAVVGVGLVEYPGTSKTSQSLGNGGGRHEGGGGRLLDRLPGADIVTYTKNDLKQGSALV